MPQPAITAAALCQWMKGDVLPFWATTAADDPLGLFPETVLANQNPDLSTQRRVRVQLRQIYTYSHAAVLGWHEAGTSVAMRCWHKLRPRAYRPDGAPGFVHRLNADGTVADARRDSYDHAFAVLAAAWLYRASGDPSVLKVLEELLAFADQHLTDAFDALREGVPDSRPYRQNPQMHWFEAMLALIETRSHASGTERAARHAALFHARLADVTGTIREYYTEQWAPLPGKQGELIEPGHHAEWAWLLRRHERLAGLPASDLPAKLLERAEAFRNPVTGLLVDEATAAGVITKPACRIWVQTEVLKAWLAEREAGASVAPAKTQEALETLHRHHLQKPFHAGWIDQVDALGNPMPGPVQTSILYHIFVALAEAERLQN